MGLQWILARTKPARDAWAAENIVKQGYPVKFPRYHEPTRCKVAGGFIRVETTRYLFPSYLFVQTDGQWRFLLGTFGVSGVVLRGESPDIVPEHAITELEQREDSNGFIQLPKPNKGDPVKIKSGHFKGLEGVYLGMTASGRVRVLMDILGRKTRTLFAEGQVTVSV